jgi:hypothetical protein
LNQNPERLTNDTLNALTTNRSHLITTALNAHAAGLIAREWGGDPPAAAITGLPRWTFIAQVTHEGKLTRPFMFAGQSVEEQFAGAFHPDPLPDVQATIDKEVGILEDDVAQWPQVIVLAETEFVSETPVTAIDHVGQVSLA